MGKRFQNIPWRLLGSIAIGLVGLVGVILLMGLVSRKDQGQVCHKLQISIEGRETFIDQADITTMIKNQFGQVVGRTLNDIPLEKIETALKELPYVSSADVNMDMDGTMRVIVQQRGILLRVINKAGQEFYIDTEGKKIPTTLKYVPHVMVANGNIKEIYKKPLTEVETDLVKDLVKIVEYVSQSQVWSNQVVQLFVNDNNDVEIVPRVGDQEIVIGNGDQLEDKLKRIEVFYKQILPKVGTEAYERVNVKYSGQIICERNGDWYIDSLQRELHQKK